MYATTDFLWSYHQHGSIFLKNSPVSLHETGFSSPFSLEFPDKKIYIIYKK